MSEEKRRELVWSALALQDLAEIRDRIATQNPKAARKQLHTLLKRAQQLTDFPNMGRAVPELPGSTFRELIEGNYRLVYKVAETTVTIATVFEGHREFPMGNV